MGRLFLHIGPHKTGTTSFQRSLEANAAELTQRGLRPVMEPQMRKGRRTGQWRTALYSSADLFLRPELLTGARYLDHVPKLTEVQRANRRARLATYVGGMTEPAVLMSSESFWYLHTENERRWIGEFADAVGREVTVIMARRDPADWRESWEQHLETWSKRFPRMRDFPDSGEMRQDWYYDIDARRTFWSPFTLCEVPFARDLDVVPDLFRATGISPEGLREGFWVNTRKD